MKVTPVIYEGETNIFTRNGATIGWVISSRDGTGFYSSYGAKFTKNFFGVKHDTAEKAEASIRRINTNLQKNVEVI